MKNKLTIKHLSILLVCLVLPVSGIVHFSLAQKQDNKLLIISLSVVFLFSLLSFLSCKKDKQKATNNEWRIPESQLHFLELLGGWPGSYLAQNLYRHKVSKKKYQIIFWFIILIYNFISIDYFNDWHISKSIIERIISSTR